MVQKLMMKKETKFGPKKRNLKVKFGEDRHKKKPKKNTGNPAPEEGGSSEGVATPGGGSYDPTWGNGPVSESRRGRWARPCGAWTTCARPAALLLPVAHQTFGTCGRVPEQQRSLKIRTEAWFLVP